jgi:protein-S-isoprenylcysteine O-methyltransferase Ste14
MNDLPKHNENDEMSTDSNVSTTDDSLASEQKEKATPLSYVENIFRSHLFTNILLAGLFSNSIYLFYADFETNHRFSSLLMMIELCCLTLFFLIRIAPAKVSMKPIDWIASIAGTCLPMLMAPVSADNEIIPLMLLQFFGIFISIVAIISLNTSFAIVPALRKLKTGGLYSLVRHPIYFGYLLTFTCVALQNFSLLNILAIIALYATDIYRIKAEEELLSIDPGYELYRMRVRYRLIPFLW